MALGGGGWEWRKDEVMAKASIFGICVVFLQCVLQLKDVFFIGCCVYGNNEY
jgi:hypothetical protein